MTVDYNYQKKKKKEQKTNHVTWGTLIAKIYSTSIENINKFLTEVLRYLWDRVIITTCYNQDERFQQQLDHGEPVSINIGHKLIIFQCMSFNNYKISSVSLLNWSFFLNDYFEINFVIPVVVSWAYEFQIKKNALQFLHTCAP